MVATKNFAGTAPAYFAGPRLVANMRTVSTVNALIDRVAILRAAGTEYVSIGRAWTRIRNSQSKAGNTHTIICRRGTDVKIGDLVQSALKTLEVVKISELNAAFIQLDADTQKAKASLRRMASLESRRASEGE